MKNAGPEIEEMPRSAQKYLTVILGLVAAVALLAVGMILQRSAWEAKAQAAYEQGRAEVDVVEHEQSVQIREVPVEVEVEKKISSEVIQDGLRSIGELATQEYSYTEVGTLEKKTLTEIFGISITLPGTKSSYIYSYDGVIKAGLDFAQIAIEKDDETKAIVATLPRCRITSHQFVEGSFELYDEKNSVFNPVSIRDFDLSNTQLKASAEKKALDKGLLETADENAKALIESFLRGGYDLEDYRITVKWD